MSVTGACDSVHDAMSRLTAVGWADAVDLHFQALRILLLRLSILLLRELELLNLLHQLCDQLVARRRGSCPSQHTNKHRESVHCTHGRR